LETVWNFCLLYCNVTPVLILLNVVSENHVCLRLMQFVSIDLQDVKEVRKRFDKASLHYDQVREKCLSLKKDAKVEVVSEAEEASRDCVQKTLKRLEEKMHGRVSPCAFRVYGGQIKIPAASFVERAVQTSTRLELHLFWDAEVRAFARSGECL
ncbi:unnamed protein product, partial [Sphagnum tenellum]